MNEAIIDWRTLNAYLNDSEAPPGLVCFVYGKPLLQIDFFERIYTVFWLGSTDTESLFIDFIQVVNEKLLHDASWYPSLLRPPLLKAFLSVTRMESVSDGVLLRRERARLRPTIQPQIDPDRSEETLHLLRQPRRVAAIQIDLEFLQRRRPRYLSVWGDTNESNKKEKEVGFTLDMAIPESPALRHLLLNTSTVFRGLPSADFDDLFETLRMSTAKRSY